MHIGEEQYGNNSTYAILIIIQNFRNNYNQIDFYIQYKNTIFLKSLLSQLFPLEKMLNTKFNIITTIYDNLIIKN